MNMFLVFSILAFFATFFWVRHGFRYYTTNSDKEGQKKPILLIIWGCTWKLVGAFFIMLIACTLFMLLVGSFMESKRIPSRHVEIYAMGDQFGVEGNLFLGFGNMEQGGYYFYYYKTKVGFKIDKIKVENATIIEDNNEIPRIQYFKSELVNESDKKWGLVSGTDYDDVVIYVPEKSIKQDIKFDLQN